MHIGEIQQAVSVMPQCENRPLSLFLGQSFEAALPSLMLCREVVNGGESKARDLSGVTKSFTDLACRGLCEISVELGYRNHCPDIVKPTHVNFDGR